MKFISYILCVLSVLCFVSTLPTAELSTSKKEKRFDGVFYYDAVNKLKLEYTEIRTKYIINQVSYECLSNTFRYFFITYLESGESHKPYINTKGGFYICENPDEYPVIDQVKINYHIGYNRFKDKSGCHVLNITSCPGNDYVIVRCKTISK